MFIYVYSYTYSNVYNVLLSIFQLSFNDFPWKRSAGRFVIALVIWTPFKVPCCGFVSGKIFGVPECHDLKIK